MNINIFPLSEIYIAIYTYVANYMLCIWRIMYIAVTTLLSLPYYTIVYMYQTYTCIEFVYITIWILAGLGMDKLNWS